MPQLGLGLGLHKSSFLGSAYNDLKRMSNALFFDPSRPDGNRFPMLAPRTLPNGVSNGDYQQMVSVDRVVQASEIVNLYTGFVTVDFVNINYPPNFKDANIQDLQGTKFVTTRTSPRYGAEVENPSNVWLHSNDATHLNISVPKGYYSDLASAKADLAGTVIRYQLATPIDTLNNPVRNPIQDQAGKVVKNLADPVLFERDKTLDSNGSLATSVGLFVTGFIPVEQLTRYQGAEPFLRVSFYNSSKVHLSSNTNGDSFRDTPANCAFMRVALLMSKIATTQIELGSSATAYEPYGKANVLMTNVGWTSADGYRVEVVKGVGSEIPYTNIGADPTFITGANWTRTLVASHSISSNEYKFTAGAQFGGLFSANAITGANGSKRFHISLDVKANSNLVNLRCQTPLVVASHSGSGNYERLSIIATPNSIADLIRVLDARTSGWSEIAVKNYQVNGIDDNPAILALEAKLGRQLTAQECDYLFTFTATSATVKADTNVFFNLDGSDTFGALNSASAPNPTGTDDFWQLVVFKPDDTVPRYFGITRNTDSGVTLQYGMLNSALGNMQYLINGDLIQLGNTITNLQYALYGRINNERFFIRDGVPEHSLAYNNNIVTRPNTQLGCRSNSADGTAKSIFSKGIQGICAMGVGPQGSIDKAKLVATVNKAMKQIYGLGV